MDRSTVGISSVLILPVFFTNYRISPHLCPIRRFRYAEGRIPRNALSNKPFLLKDHHFLKAPTLYSWKLYNTPSMANTIFSTLTNPVKINASTATYSTIMLI